MVRALVFALAALLLAAPTCRQADPRDGEPPAATAPSGADDPAAAPLDLLEAVFRYQFEHNASAVQHSASAYCLSPAPAVPEELLRRFAGHRPPVYAESACPGGEGALTFRINSVRFLSDAEAEVIGGYHEGNLSSSTESYRAVFQEGAWRVVESRLLVISSAARVV